MTPGPSYGNPAGNNLVTEDSLTEPYQPMGTHKRDDSPEKLADILKISSPLRRDKAVHLMGGMAPEGPNFEHSDPDFGGKYDKYDP
jgi:hypothetical protein